MNKLNISSGEDLLINYNDVKHDYTSNRKVQTKDDCKYDASLPAILGGKPANSSSTYEVWKSPCTGEACLQ